MVMRRLPALRKQQWVGWDAIGGGLRGRPTIERHTVSEAVAPHLALRQAAQARLLREAYLATILGQAKPVAADELVYQPLDWAARSRLAPFVELARTIRKHAVGILAYLDTQITNGPVEGINNKLRVIARRAYGFHSHGPLIPMLFLCSGGILLTPPLPTRI